MHAHAILSHLARMLHEFYSVWSGSPPNTVRCNLNEAQGTDHWRAGDLALNRVT